MLREIIEFTQKWSLNVFLFVVFVVFVVVVVVLMES